jgi:hypothetical protein
MRRERKMSHNQFSPTDEAWGALLDDEILNEKRKAAEQRFRDLSGVQISLLRRRVKTDLLALAGILEYDLLTVGLHGHYAAWLKKMWGQRYRMTLLPRDHYKSTENTTIDSIQMVLPNEAGVVERPYCLGPNLKMLLAHENRESASRFLYGITQAFRSKPWMLALFPDMIPSPRTQRMNKWELELPRDEHHNEPTFDTIGVGGAAQGRHYNWLKLDDLVGEAARDSETVMRTTLMWFDNVNSLLTRLKVDGWDLTGTRWSATDVYAHAISMYGIDKSKSILRVYSEAEIERIPEGQLVVYARGAIEDGLPIFPEEFSLSDLNRIRRNPRVWAAQYANNPRSGELTRLDPAWLKYYNIGTGDRLIVFEGEGSRTARTSEMDRVILIDPSVGESKHSDESGIVVTGTDKKMNVYVLEAYRKRLKPPELIEEMFRLYTKWNPRLISIESVAFSAMLKYWFDQKCRELGIYPNIYDYKPGSQRSKTARIEGLANYGAGGQLYVLEGMHQLRDEWEWFPLGETDHILDALAQGPEVWSPVVIEQAKEMEKATRMILEDRDDLTGYSSM